MEIVAGTYYTKDPNALRTEIKGVVAPLRFGYSAMVNKFTPRHKEVFSKIYKEVADEALLWLGLSEEESR